MSMRAARHAPECPPQPSASVSRARRLIRALFLVVVASVIVPGAFPADRASDQRDADARQTLYVRRAVGEDAALAPHAGDVWIEVQGTTAILSGKLPSAMLKQRAVYLAGQVKGIAAVRADDLQVATPDGVSDVPSPFVEGVPPRGTLAGDRKDGHATREPMKAELPDTAPSAASPPGVTLLAPIHVTAPAPAPSAGSLVEFLPPRPLPEESDLPSAVEALRRKEERYRRLKVEVRGKTVYLSGTAPRWADVADLTNAVRRLPGVERVIQDAIQVDPHGAR
jgi:osmotically-inducible protein OsmY